MISKFQDGLKMAFFSKMPSSFYLGLTVSLPSSPCLSQRLIISSSGTKIFLQLWLLARRISRIPLPEFLSSCLGQDCIELVPVVSCPTQGSKPCSYHRLSYCSSSCCHSPVLLVASLCIECGYSTNGGPRQAHEPEILTWD
jgi:hypothetical protein